MILTIFCRDGTTQVVKPTDQTYIDEKGNRRSKHEMHLFMRDFALDAAGSNYWKHVVSFT